MGCNTSVRFSVLIPNAFVIRLIVRNRQARSDLEARLPYLLGLQVREPRHMADIVCCIGPSPDHVASAFDYLSG